MIGWLCLSIALSAWVFSPILGVYFHNDDFIHLFNIVDLGFARFAVEPFAMHSLVVRNVALYAVYQAFGPDPRASFAVVLGTHALNTGLLFLAARALTSSPSIAFFGAALWGTAPVLAGSLGWYTVYGHVLVGTCLAGMLAALAPSCAAARPPHGAALACSALLAVAASASFGTGLGVAAAFPLLVLLPFAPPRATSLRAAAAVLVPLVAAASYFAVAWWGVAGDVDSSSGAVGSLLAQTKWTGLLRSLFHMLRFGGGELMLGATGMFRASSSVGMPAAVGSDAAVAVVWLLYGAALLVTWIWSPSRIARLASVLFLTACACYLPVSLAKGPIAARHPAFLAEQARYHYASLIPLALLLCLGLDAIARRWPASRRAGGWILAGWVALVVAVQVLDPLAIERYDGDRELVGGILQEIREQVDASPPSEAVLVADRRFEPTRRYLDLGSAALFLIHHPAGSLDGRPVRFRVPAEMLNRAVARREYAARFLVAD